MNVIGHDHIATNGDVEAGFGTFGKKGKCRMNVVAGKKRLSLVSAKSDEIQGASIKGAVQTWRPLPEIRFHAKGVATALRAVQSKTVGFVDDRPQAGGYKVYQFF